VYFVLTHGGRAQREAMATMGMLEHHPHLMKLALDLMAVLGSVIGIVATALGGDVQCGGGGWPGGGAE